MNSSPFVLKELPVKGIDYESLTSQMGSANRFLGRFDSLMQTLPSTAILIPIIQRREAIGSTKIEGTMTNLKEVLDDEQQPLNKRSDDSIEVLNYSQTLWYATRQLEKEQFPFSLRLIKNCHKQLMQGARAKGTAPGEFRKIQNWIGAREMQNASYIPPSADKIMPLLDNWEKYIHSSEKDSLIQVAIVHAQFELIHPFLDGNGRIGRILIPLFLWHKQIIHKPVFYMSELLELKRDEYFECLNQIHQSGDWNGWIKFFLQSVEIQARHSYQVVQKIMELHKETLNKISSTTHSRYAQSCTDFLFKNILFKTSTFADAYQDEINRNTALNLINQIEKAEVVRLLKKGSGRRANLYFFNDLYELLEKSNLKNSQ